MNDRTALIAAYGRLLRRCTVTDGDDPCIIWTGAVTGDGYSSFRFRGVLHYGHRLAMAARGHQLDGMDVHHASCGNRRCVLGAHLQVLTHAEHARVTNADLRRLRAERGAA